MNRNMDYIYSKSDVNFAVSTNEEYWWFDDNNTLKSVLCIENDEEKILPVTWDDDGAYVEHNEEKIYIVNYIE